MAMFMILLRIAWASALLVVGRRHPPHYERPFDRKALCVIELISGAMERKSKRILPEQWFSRIKPGT
jgi:hypothetical protein